MAPETSGSPSNQGCKCNRDFSPPRRLSDAIALLACTENKGVVFAIESTYKRDHDVRSTQLSLQIMPILKPEYLNGEIAIHFPGLEGLDKPIVWVFPKLLVCLNCGFAEFAIPEAEVRRIVESDAASA